MLKKLLINGVLVSILIFTSACTVISQALQKAEEPTPTATEPAPTQTATPTEVPTSTVTPTVTATLPPTATSTPTEKPYTLASEMSAEMAGENVQVCGMVTDYEEIYCPNCINGFYAYLTLDDNFYVLSYEWGFSTNWIGSYIMVKDTVETMGSNPIFVFGGTEGWDETECERESDGSLHCATGSYFKFVPYCAN